jgi:hypothetical protein
MNKYLNIKELRDQLDISLMQLKKLKLDNHRKQIVATRLLVQRNSLKFLNTKITQTLVGVLKKIKCHSPHDKKTNIFEVINAIIERVEEAWGKYDVVFRENKELINELNAKNEEITFLTETLKNTDSKTLESTFYVPPIENKQGDRLSEEAQPRVAGQVIDHKIAWNSSWEAAPISPINFKPFKKTKMRSKKEIEQEIEQIEHLKKYCIEKIGIVEKVEK